VVSVVATIVENIELPIIRSRAKISISYISMDKAGVNLSASFLELIQ
jgi:hypothetical protein